MAVAQMDRITVYGLKKERKRILEKLQRLGTVEVTITNQTDGYENLDTVKSRNMFEKVIDTTEQALQILASYVPEKKSMLSMLDGPESLSGQQYDANLPRVEKSFNVAKAILQAEKEKSEFLSDIARRENLIVSLKDWTALGVPMTYAGTNKTAALVGVFPESKTQTEILTAYQELFSPDEEIPAIDLQVISTGQEQTCVLIFCLKKKKEQVEQKLRNLGFARPAVFTSMVPAERIKRHQKKIALAGEEIKMREKTIGDYATERENLKFLVDYYTTRLEKYEVLEKVAQGRRTFVISGYLPHSKSQEAEQELTEMNCAAVEISPIGPDDDPPVMLENNGFSAPVETVLETYSMPGRGEADPTSVMAIFYYVLFGLMLSDAAYGLLMVIACGLILWKFKNISSGLKKSMTMFFYCGISTTFWGVMFGSYFGDAITVVSTTFFHNPVTIPPLWFEPVKEPMRMLVFSMAFGIVHLFTGLAMRLIAAIKEKDYITAIFDVICWYLVVGGGIVYLLSMQMFADMVSLSFVLPPIAGKIAAICAGIGAIGIILFAGRSSKNPGKRIAKGLYELYGVTSYLSDILSYSRLLALGLATGVIAQVFNKMGSMFGDGVIGFILFVIVFLIGHTVNIAINVLGAYVHTNRLQFVEFFGKFYEGGGRKYHPFSVKTKYYQFEEEK